MAAERFFQRWAKRKAEFAKAENGKPDVHPVEDAVKPATASGSADASMLPTMDDVKHLAADSDYSLFVAKGTDPTVRRAAMKVLFSDPHFNAMDGLDVYIGDYTRPTPLTPAMLAALQHARSMFPSVEEQEQEPEPDKAGKNDPPAPEIPDMPDMQA
ncbi:DUF3306 domain-containing protein [Noviherbaspirillum sp.]|uniref:DUF3306 domain-containing protein n=1 Tax=Noviherbaspirillum sp. TaxID=1926288 RepID=UPI002B45C670|nr:DUF3306 domain-containing protein [Noviherbaspirillum sp.]HJV80937.1 DUF3306 domain-containing protein [Noviherbaspirillum sp.]